MDIPAGVRRKAIHEAAHAVSARMRGIDVKSVKIGTTLDPQAETELDLPDPMTASKDGELLESLAETYLAAREAAHIILGSADPPFAYEEDLKQVDDIAVELGVRGGESSAWFAARRAGAAASVERDRPKIEAVADELVVRRYLTGADVERLLADPW